MLKVGSKLEVRIDGCQRPREMGSVRDDDDVAEEEEELHVLAVDDSLVDRMVVEKLLRTSSLRVTVAESGNRALQYLGLLNGDESSSGLKVDLVLTDYSMPGMNGYELMKKIKESTAFREVPVVIMSSENILPRIDRCLEEGATDYIIKPVKLSDVKRLKDYMIRGPSYQSAAKEERNKDSSNRTVPMEYSTVNVPSSLLSPPADSSSTSSQSKLLSSTSEQKPPHSPRCSRRRPRQQRHRRC